MLNKYRLVTALALYTVCTLLAYPYYKYLFCYDEIGYLSVMQRLAAGDYYTAINGYWSPMLSWLALPLYKAGLNLIFSIRLISMLAGAGIVMAVDRLLKRIDTTGYVHTTALFICIPIVLSYVFCQQAADVLLCLLLLTYTCIITGKGFFENRTKNILCGIIGCTCYFTKAYAFPFFLVHFTLVQVVLHYNSTSAYRKKWLVRNLVAGIGVFLLLASPWLYALYHKYRMVTFGYSGKLNYYWHIYQFQPNAEKLRAIDPAPYNSLWEDPYKQPWNFQPHPPFSLKLVQKQLAVLYRNITSTIEYFNQMSFLGVAILLSFVLYVIKKRNTVLTLLLLVITVMPAGYLLVGIEYRYLYVITFIMLITGSLLLSELWRVIRVHKYVQITGWCIFFASFLFFPVRQFSRSIGKDPFAFQLAASFKKNGVKGKITTTSAFSYSWVEKASFLTGNKYYCFTRNPRNYEELLLACRQSGIDYYIYFYYSPTEAEGFRNSILYKNAIRETAVIENQVIIIQLK